MDNLNIKNLFMKNNPNAQFNSTKKITVDSLVNSNTFKTSISDDYIIDKIMTNKKNLSLKVKGMYESKYAECLVKIDQSLGIGLTDMLFSVETSYFDCTGYNSIECLTYIQDKLNKKNFLTMIVSNKQLFVSWKYIDEIG